MYSIIVHYAHLSTPDQFRTADARDTQALADAYLSMPGVSSVSLAKAGVVWHTVRRLSA